MKTSYRQTMHFLLRYINREKGSFRSLMAFRILAVVTELATTIYFAKFIKAFSSSHDITTAAAIAIGVIGSLLIVKVIDFVSRRIIEFLIVGFETRQMAAIYKEGLASILSHGTSFFADSFSGSLVKKLNKASRGFESLIDNIVFNQVNTIFSILIILVVLWGYNHWLSIGLATWTIIFIPLQYIVYQRLGSLAQPAEKQESKLSGISADLFSNHASITSCGTYERELEQAGQQIEERRKLTHKHWMRQNLFFTFNTIGMVIMEVGMMRAIIKLYQSSSISFETIIIAQVYVFRLIGIIFFYARSLKQFYHALDDTFELVEIVNKDKEIVDKKDAIPLVVTNGAVDFTNVTFGYFSVENPLFSEFSLHIRPGEKVALVGQSGSGKSTIVKLLYRLYDIQHGSITIDGQNISDVTQLSLRSSIALVPQDTSLFHRTIKENIAYARPGATDEEIIEAAKLAYCHDFISALPEGYESMVGERGVKLSGGERQRIAIARAILSQRPILILDEATSALDTESEKFIQQAIHNVIEKKTAIVIAHRLSTIKEMDRIIVMEKGKIVEQGTHDELLQKSGIYHKLWQLQG